MIAAHTAAIRQLPRNLAATLASALVREGLLDNAPFDPEELAETIAATDLTQAEVVMTLATDTSQNAIETVERLIERPIYLCARGETGLPLTNIHGQPISTPVGQRRLVASPGTPPEAIRRLMTRSAKRDHRTITWKQETNPKRAGSKAAGYFDMYQIGMSLDELDRAGVPRADIRYDISRGYIRVSDR